MTNQGLPRTWVRVPLDDLIDFALGGDWGKAPDHDDPDYVQVRCIRASEIPQWETARGESAALRRIKAKSLAKRKLQEGDLLVEISGGGPEQPVGRTLLIDRTVFLRNPETPKVCTNFFRLVRPVASISSSYLNSFLQHFYYSGQIHAYQGGSNNLRNLKFNDYLTISVPVPPANEQRRIVAKIEELFSELDKGVESLKTAREQLKVCRQAVLKHAFQGKLTAKWREENKDKLQTPDELLARIKREREACYEEQLDEWQATVKEWEADGSRGPKPRKPVSYKPRRDIGDDERALLPAIPVSWRYVRLSEMAEVGSGMSVSASRKLANPIEVAYLRVANVQRGFLNLAEIKHMDVEKSQLGALTLKKWDVLFNEGGDRDKLGRGWIWQGELEQCITQNHVFRASLFSPCEAAAKLLSHWGNTFGQGYFEKTGKQTTNLASINKTVLSEFPVPLISLAEQEVMQERIERITTVIDAQEHEIEEALQRAEVMRQAILKAAFSGRLVAQDPDDEPASVLLARIMEEKGRQKENNKRKDAA